MKIFVLFVVVSDGIIVVIIIVIHNRSKQLEGNQNLASNY